MRDIPDLMNNELDKLEQKAKLILFTVDLSRIAQEAGVHRFYNGVNEKAEPLVWQGLTYDPFPSQIDGIKFSGSGGNGKPTLTLSNITGMITGLIINYQDMVGAKVTLKFVDAKFLDAVNFEGGNEFADPNQETVMIYIVNKMNQLNNKMATFELALPGEYTNDMIPRRTINATTCGFRYRGDGCGYTGDKYFNYKDEPVTSIDEDVCGHREASCKARFGENSPIPIGCCLAVNKVS